MACFIGLHIGAGYHSEKYDSSYKKLCKDACLQGMTVLKNGGDSIEAVAVATKVLEDSELTNAGYGSNMTWDGTVECDACIMEGKTLRFGGVGALAGITNPICVAKALCRNQGEQLSLGRVQPCLLVGEGARQWAVRMGISSVSPSSLLSEKAKKKFVKYKSKAENETTHAKISWKRMDTVGAVAVDLDGIIASSCSSGGLFLKQSGRVGQAGIFGCGCWAENFSEELRCVGISTSGAGEDIIRTYLAKEVARSLSSCSCAVTSLHKTMNESFLNSRLLIDHSQKLCGVIGLISDMGCGEFIWGHTSQSMGIGYMSSENKVPKVCISRLPSNILPGSKVLIEGIRW